MSIITSREYKIMLDHRRFTPRKEAVAAFWKDLKRIARRCAAEVRGAIDDVDKRTIQFLDTPDYTLRHNHLLLRLRQKQDGQADYTLKCRHEDRYVAAGRDLSPGKGADGRRKFEEDIAPPFRTRYSQSTTISGEKVRRLETITQASRFVPILGTLTHDGRVCDGATPLGPVDGFIAYERVLKGLSFRLADEFDTEIAIILWSASKNGRTVCAEFSFRYENEREQYAPKVAESAFRLYAALQSLDWCVPGATTKTQFAYGER